MKMNRVNFLILSHYIKNRKKQSYEIDLIAYHIVPGSDESIVTRKDQFTIAGFKDYQRLKLMCKNSMARLMQKIDDANR